LTAAETNEVGQVRMAAGKLLDLHRAREIEARNGVPGETFVQVRFQPGPVECFTNIPCVHTSGLPDADSYHRRGPAADESAAALAGIVVRSEVEHVLAGLAERRRRRRLAAERRAALGELLH